MVNLVTVWIKGATVNRRGFGRQCCTTAAQPSDEMRYDTIETIWLTANLQYLFVILDQE